VVLARAGVTFALVMHTTVAVGSEYPHTPTEAELLEKLSPSPDDSGRNYQADSVKHAKASYRAAVDWLKRTLAAIPHKQAWLLAGLGLLGVASTWNKNKRKQQWLVLTILSYALLIAGAAAIVWG